MNAGERLKKIRKDILKLTQQELAEKLGYKWYKIKDMETGKQKVTEETAKLLEKYFSINPWWLLTGEGEMYNKTQIIDEKKGIEVNYYPDVYAAAGYGAVNTLIEPKKIKLAEFILKFFGIKNYKNVDIINVLGDSMEPVFNNGDLVIVERINTLDEIKNGDTVIINIDGDVYIKKVEKIPFENKLILKSNNSLYKDIIIDLNEHKNIKIAAVVKGKFRLI
jgi:phage repressor protein C with HTH and peptisase S24 domain